MNPLISIIVPVFRVEKYLDKCIQSIINQTYKNIEIILVDDGSDDGCGQICDRYALIDKRIRVVHKTNAGQDSARKEGMRLAQGEYIGYVDSDDWIEPEMYEVLLEDACKYDVDVVESGTIDNYEEQEKMRCPYLPEGVYKNKAFEEKVLSVFMYTGRFFEAGITPYLVTKLFKKKVIEKYQLWDDEIQTVLDDNIVTYATIANSKSLYIDHRCFYHYKLNNASTKHSINLKIDQYLIGTVEGYKKRIRTNNFNIDKQIEFNSMYHLIARLPQVFDKKDDAICLVPYGGIPRDSRIVLYGAGSVGIHMWHYLKSIEELEVALWVDRNYKNIENNYNVKNPECIINELYDYVVISVMRESAVKSIYRDLKSLGVDATKIKWIDEKFLKNPEHLLKMANFANIDLLQQT